MWSQNQVKSKTKSYLNVNGIEIMMATRVRLQVTIWNEGLRSKALQNKKRAYSTETHVKFSTDKPELSPFH